jgi:acyl transferase domain-containing protein
MGGANAHVIVDAAPPAAQQNGVHVSTLNGSAHPNGTHTNGIHTNGTTPYGKSSEPVGGQRLLVFSANSEGSLRKMISNYEEFIERESFRLSDLAYTLSVRRHHWNVRSFCVTDGKTFQTVPGSRILKFKGLLFIFTGQGAQWSGMGRELIRDFPTFREDIQKMDMWLAESSHPPSWKIESTSHERHPFLSLLQHGISTDSGTQISYGILRISIQRSSLSQSVQHFRLHW